MANKDDYLTGYREFFENFAQTLNPHDQLPVRLGGYKLLNLEVVGGVIDWTTQYLTQKECPQSLMAPLIQIIIDETRKSCKKQPVACGFNPSDNAYEPLKLMQTVMAKTNDICMRYLDNSMLCSLPSPGPPGNVVSVCAAKNKRRRMEDRHVIVQDLNVILNIQDASPSSYYAIFDGHAGHDAAAYSAAHLHQYLAESKHFISNPEQALLDAFCKTDALFVEKCNVERFSSGTTAVVALHRPKEKVLYVAWVGDSQALLVNQKRILQCVHPHKPCREDEKKRIEEKGGFVTFWGTWRVNGQLAVSRAIGDLEYKPYVSAVPEIREISLDGGEDFLILACDGLWDFVSEDAAAQCVYEMICQCPDNTDSISERLVQLSKENGSGDNISVIVVFLREPSKIAVEGAHWAKCTMDASLDNANNPFANSNGSSTDNNMLGQKADGLLLNLSENFKQNGSDSDFFTNVEKTNGTKSHHEDNDGDFDDGGDLGPETDVDAIDDVGPPSAMSLAKNLADGVVNNNPEGGCNPFVEKVEKAALVIDLDLVKQQSSEFDVQRSPREETPTPPADVVHGGLEDNLGDSGEESEDEWNYIKGEEADKENADPLTQPDLEVARILEESDNMSQLNPNAAEFVPVSPTRSIPSPACRALIDDPVIAQSPNKATNVDIHLPNEEDFETEIKSRPSDIADACSNGHGDDGTTTKPSVDLMENILNGKNIDEIVEFQPGTTPTKVSPDEFHFGPNAAPFNVAAKLLDQSEISNQAVCGDDSTATIGLSFNESDFGTPAIQGFGNKESDPMSMSFYQDKEDATDPFDLNKVQVIPDDIDDFLSKPNEQVCAETATKTLDNDERIQTTDLDRIVDDEKELESPPMFDDCLIGMPWPLRPDEVAILPERIDTGAAPPPLQLEPEVFAVPDSPRLNSTDEEKICQWSRSPVPLQPEIVEIPPPSPHLESLVEDVTSSVKDSISPLVQSPIPDDTPLLEVSREPVEGSPPLKEEPLVVTPKSATDTESVATADVQSLIETTQIPDVESPLSPNEEDRQGVVECAKTENILLEFAQPAIGQTLTPSAPPPPQEEEVLAPASLPVKEEVPQPVVEKKPPVAKARVAPIKKTTLTKSPATTKAAPKLSSAAAATSAARLSSPKTTSPTKPNATKTTPTASRLVGVPKPRVPLSGATTAAKKALTNGEVKTSAAPNLAAKKSAAATARPATASARAPAPRSGDATTVPKTRPTTLAARVPLVGAKTTTATKSPLTTIGLPKAPPAGGSAAPVKARPFTGLTKPRVTLTKTIPKTTPDAEKQNKESANKLTASRTTTATSRTSSAATGKTTSTARKTETRTVSGTSRTTLSKTTTTSAKSSTSGAGGLGGKKPLEITRNVKSKITKIEKPIQNGRSTVVTEQITVVRNGIVDSEPQLLKDNSPVDNKLIEIVDINNATD